MALLVLWILAAIVSAWQAFSAGAYTAAFVYAAATLIVPGAALLLARP